LESTQLSWLEQALAWAGNASSLSAEAVATGSVGLIAGILLGALLGGILGSVITAAVLSRNQRRMGDRFQALSSDALDRNSERFLTLAGERLGSLERSSSEALAQREAAVDALVRPLRESLARVDEKLQKVETERQGHYQSLTKHLELVATSHRELERQTRGLGQALRTPNVRGRWGELQLRRVVELAGMLDHCDFQEQVSFDGEAGRQRPDMIVHLPGGREIVIDAKAPLQAYLAASEAEDEATRTQYLDEHARHVRRHVDDLGKRKYWSQLDGSPEFVVLFLPGEPFFSAALAHDPELIERGVDSRVLLAGPTTLIALLRAVAYGWQQEAMAENAVQVSKLGRELFDRIVGLNERFGQLGKKLDGAVEAFNAAVGSLESRVHVSARRMAELGVAKSSALDRVPTLDRRTRNLNDVSESQGAAPTDSAEA
jgi:DNA recombination protein RmuC